MTYLFFQSPWRLSIVTSLLCAGATALSLSAGGRMLALPLLLFPFMCWILWRNYRAIKRSENRFELGKRSGVFYESATHNFMWAFYLSTFLLVGLMCWPDYGSWLWWFVFVLLLFATLEFLRKAAQRRPVLMITRHGILARQWDTNNRLVPWSAISDVALTPKWFPWRSRWFINLWLKPDFLAKEYRPKPYDRLTLHLSQTLRVQSRPATSVPLHTLGVAPADVMFWVRKFAPKHVMVHWQPPEQRPPKPWYLP
jgi:hypothetical protein